MTTAQRKRNEAEVERLLNWSQAEADADLPWVALIVCDIVNGKHCWLATNPDLPSCAGQGETEAEALVQLWYARRDYLLSRYEAGLPCPRRRSIAEFTSEGGSASFSRAS
jgi:predicted RNase H-like HicB family nuclease